VLNDLKSRGVRDLFFCVCDGLKGLPESVNTVFPATIVQTCIIHLIRGTFHYASRKYWDELSRDLKPIYQAVGADAGRPLGQFVDEPDPPRVLVAGHPVLHEVADRRGVGLRAGYGLSETSPVA
jgi:mutator family transposase